MENFQILPISLIVLSYPDFIAEDKVDSIDEISCKKRMIWKSICSVKNGSNKIYGSGNSTFL